MPSGLTAAIYRGSDMSLRSYALKCITQLGAGLFATEQFTKEMPYDKAPVIPINDYHLKELKKAKKELEHWLKIKKNPKELNKLYQDYLDMRERENSKYSEDKSKIKARYLTMKAKVEPWELSEEYASLKEIMLKQLDESIKHDCRDYKPYGGPPLSKEGWLALQISATQEEIELHAKGYDREVERVKELNDYLQGFYDALDRVEPIV